jgi:5-methylcytosine-specific restriction endonuclease McrA
MAEMSNGRGAWLRDFIAQKARPRKSSPKPARKKKTKAQARIDLYLQILARDGVVRCVVCGHPVSLRNATVEHIVPRSKLAGRTPKNNLGISHGSCNHRRGDADLPWQADNGAIR